MAACFAEGLPDPMIAARVEAETGEKLAVRTIGRRKADWRAQQSRIQRGREQMQSLLEAARAGNATASEMVNALAREQLQRDPEGTLAVDPIELQRVSVAAERVRLQAKGMELKERQLALDEKRFALMQAREDRAIAALKGEGDAKTLSADERLRKIYEIYGVKHEAA